MKNLRFFYLVLLLVLGAGLGSAQAQQFEWAKLARTLSNNATGFPTGATDAAGNTYAHFGFRDSVRVGTQTLVGNGPSAWNARASVLVKYDSTGQVLWTRRLVGIQVDLRQMATDTTNSGVFIAGRFGPAPTWSGAAIAGAVPNAYFYAKCTANGTLQWVRTLPALNRLSNIVADNAGNCYLMGVSSRTATVGGVTVDSTQNFVLKSNAAGLTQWTKIYYGDRGFCGLAGVCNGRLGPKPGGGCLVVGAFNGGIYQTGTTAPLVVSSGLGSSGFILSLDAAGSVVGTQLIVGSPTNGAEARFEDATADAAGNVYATGGTYRTTYIGSLAVQPGIFVVKYNAAGILQWLRNQQASAATNSADAKGWQLVVDAAENVTVVASSDYSIGAPPTIIGGIQLKAPYNFVRFDAQGTVQWAVSDDFQGFLPSPGGVSGVSTFFIPYSLDLDRRGNLYSVGTPIQYSLFRAVMQLGNQTVVGKGVIITKINTHHNILTGRVYLDSNNNGQRDAGEGDFSYPLVLETGQTNSNTFGTSLTAGSYTMYVDSGAYSLSIPNVPLHYSLTQPTASNGAYQGRFNGYGRTDSLRDFGLHPIANQPDLRVTLTPYAMARLGAVNRLRFTIENVGTTTAPAGAATVTLDSRMQYIATLPSGTFNVATATVTMQYGALVPLAKTSFDISYSVPINVPIGTNLTIAGDAPLVGDLVPSDNYTASENLTVIGSYDPNDITVNYSRLTPAQVSAAQPLDYTVRFQNMGNDTAFVVVITDTLNFHKLNLGTMQLVAQSHNCTWSLSGQGLLTVRFLNIKLPYRNQDVIRSQGFVRFRVQPRTTLAIGEVIPNHADIFFDYNAPVRTNTATTTVMQLSALSSNRPVPAWAAYPNPAHDNLTVSAELTTPGPVRLELLDALGRAVRQYRLDAPAGPLRQALDLRDVSPGLYVLRLHQPDGRVSSQRVVRE